MCLWVSKNFNGISWLNCILLYNTINIIKVVIINFLINCWIWFAKCLIWLWKSWIWLWKGWIWVTKVEFDYEKVEFDWEKVEFGV